MEKNGTIENKTVEENFIKWNIPHPMQDYMVVVHCSTYNHGKYIEDALKGFVMQQTNFPFCAIVIDDGSTDDAPAIIRQYAEQYPDIIKPILLGENHMQHGKSRNPYFDEWHNVAKYIAMCEGDDYWTDPLKLQKQVDFLEEHEDVGLCYTDCDIYYEKNHTWQKSICKERIFDIIDSKNPFVGNYGYMGNATWLYRSETKNHFSPKNRRIDGALQLLYFFCSKSQIGYLPINSAVYRRHEGSASCFTDDQSLKDYNYSKDVFLTMLDYVGDFNDSESLKKQIFKSGLKELYLRALKNNDREIVELFTEHFEPILDLEFVNNLYLDAISARNSFSYKLGRTILKPFSWIKRS